MNEDMSLIDILLSRLFHDLVSPVSATVNGAELISDLGADGGGDLGQEALSLIGSSARQASERLSFFRVAFGGAGSTDDHSLADGAALAQPYLKARKIAFELECAQEPKLVRPPLGGVKAALGFICALCECLPRGGTILLSAGDGGGERMSLIASGDGANLLPDVAFALEEDAVADDLTSKSVVAYVAARNARRFGLGFGAEEAGGKVEVRLWKL
ncbi:histidine phosphotransferase family protein [Nisaea acidiphila]|uniref:Histidine phosphotransferase family protein n=1 Tax=Nisaea acidiphila TaxID=1862145 RepID=A0A9J7AVN7_9PROT|nr:histidine phosphotransferase family protein [Nisaea acidiphila]UUX50529.1 histidine phosphotransferase family protein [Nisaea acidiphila]